MLTEIRERTKSHQESSIVRMALETELACVISIQWPGAYVDNRVGGLYT